MLSVVDQTIDSIAGLLATVINKFTVLLLYNHSQVETTKGKLMFI